MITREFWQERSTGEVWAVELCEGVVTACCGPLGISEIDERFLDALDYSTERAAWIEQRREEFGLYNPAVPYC